MHFSEEEHRAAYEVTWMREAMGQDHVFQYLKDHYLSLLPPEVHEYGKAILEDMTFEELRDVLILYYVEEAPELVVETYTMMKKFEAEEE